MAESAFHTDDSSVSGFFFFLFFYPHKKLKTFLWIEYQRHWPPWLLRSSAGDNGRRFGQAKVVNTSLLVYQSAAREEERSAREGEREREADFPQTHCKVGINSAIARAAPLLKHREGRSVRERGLKPARERRIAQTVAGSGGVRGEGGVSVLGRGGGFNSDVCEAGARLREAEQGVWGWLGKTGQ